MRHGAPPSRSRRPSPVGRPRKQKRISRSGLSLCHSRPRFSSCRGPRLRPPLGFSTGSTGLPLGLTAPLYCRSYAPRLAWGSQNASGSAPLAARPTVLRNPSFRRPSVVVARPRPKDPVLIKTQVWRPVSSARIFIV
ncbi:hypothetical protein NDU88_005624 [Pleurodeles waltl]|uniref:Uncharacterized protein n=1 Tax=Pleurodeles waltl TaxID=8319 RepID=A0AAV7WY71_PLEWA|nr:hypothetical protein NDU88_005624 [Pleurodeles waltl]